MRMAGIRVAARGVLGLVILLGIRDPLALALTALLLWPGARRFQPGFWSALSASILPAAFWGFSAFAICFLSGVVGVLIIGHVTGPQRGAWHAMVADAGNFRRRFLASTDSATRITSLIEHVPLLPARRVQPVLESACWVIVLGGIGFLLFGTASLSPATSAGAIFVAETPSGLVRMDRQGRYALGGPAGGVEVIHDGAVVRVVKSDCPGHRCERQSVLWGGILCVPNRILIRPASGVAGEDGSTGIGTRYHSWTG